METTIATGRDRLTGFLLAACLAAASPAYTADKKGRVLTAADLVALPTIGDEVGAGLSVSPDGRYFAFQAHRADIASNDYRVAWYVAETDESAAPVEVGDGGDAELFRGSSGAWIGDYAKWRPDSSGITYRKRHDGQTQIWWSNREGTLNEQWTHNAADVERFVWNRDGSKIYFVTDADRAAFDNREASRYRNGYVFDYGTSWSTIDGMPQDSYSLTGGVPRVWVLDVAEGSEYAASDIERAEFERLERPAVHIDAAPKARRLTRSDESGAVAWVQADDPAKQGVHPPLTVYVLHPREGGHPVRCSAPECTGMLDPDRPIRGGIQWTPGGKELLFARMEGTAYSTRSVYAWDVPTGRVRKVHSTDEWISDCSAVRRELICFRQTPIHPRTVVSIGVDSGVLETLVDLNRGFQDFRLGDVELFEWRNASGYETFGYLVKPPDFEAGNAYPLVFVGYRARWAFRGGIGDEYPVHVLAANGFVVLVYEKPTVYEAMEVYSERNDIGRAIWGNDLFEVRMARDSFASAIRILAERGLVDPDRVAVTGLSAGASDVNYSLIHSDLFAAAIASSIVWPEIGSSIGGSAGEVIRSYRTAIGADSYCGRDGGIRNELSLGLNVERVRAPLLVNVSDSEHAMAITDVTKLIEYGKPVEMIVYPDEGHIKWQPAHRLAVYERNVDWLNFWLRGLEDSDPRKQERLARWRRLYEMRDEHARTARATSRHSGRPDASGAHAAPVR